MTQHYFSETPAGDYRLREIEAVLGGAPRNIVTAGGVFSPEQLDRGTAVLLRSLETVSPLTASEDAVLSSAEAATSADDSTNTAVESAAVLAERDSSPAILDIGCGWGAIALDAALRAPDQVVWAIDVNERSRELTRTNAERLGLSNVRVAAPEEVPAGLRFSEIRSNPPIRVGKEVLHGILSTWLPRLLPGGIAYLVVAKHLGADSLQRWIDSEFDGFDVDRVARDKGFHIIRAERLV